MIVDADSADSAAQYRHVSNLRTPFDALDRALLTALGDYRIGPPLAAKHRGATPQAKLIAKDIVGLYVTLETLQRLEIMARTGWKHPEKMLRNPL